MPWFPDFVAAAELARLETRAAGHADPVAQYLHALAEGRTRTLETVWPGHIEIFDPYAGDVHGHRHLRTFVRNSQAFLADHLLDVEPVASTSVRGRAVVELLAHLNLDGDAVTWPVAVVAESPDDQSVTFRTYGSQWPVVRSRPVRPPILSVDLTAEPGDVIGRYLGALETGDRDALVDTFAADGCLQEPIGADLSHRGTAELRAYFAASLRDGAGIGLEPCRVTDDGARCALELNWVRWGDRPLPPQAGIVVFDRAADDRLASVRYYDDLEAPAGT
jgi:hypothetical protein